MPDSMHSALSPVPPKNFLMQPARYCVNAAVASGFRPHFLNRVIRALDGDPLDYFPASSV